MDFLLVFLISPKLVGTTYKTEQREYPLSLLGVLGWTLWVEQKH